MKEVACEKHPQVDPHCEWACPYCLVDRAWRKVEDALPESQTLVLVYAPNCNIIGSVLIGQYFVEEEPRAASWTVYDFGDSNLGEKVTHWMPLPDAPNS